MNVVDLHPEDLIDKLTAEELTASERARLDAHLAQCSACRFEIGVRADLEQEMPLFAERPQLTFPSVTERTRPAGEAKRVSASIRTRSRRRWPLVMFAAAFVLCAGGATAAVLTGAVQARWLPWIPETKPALLAAAPAPSAKASAKSKRVAAKPALATETEAEPVAAAPESAALAPSLSAAPVTAVAPVSAAAPLSTAVALPVRRAAVASAPPAPPSSVLAPSAAPVEDAAPRLDPAAALFADANRARRDGNAERAVTLYRSLQTRYPSSSESELSRALLAQLLLDRGSPEAALAGFDRYLAQGAPVLGAEALVGRARALEQLGKTAQAVAAWREVQSRFAGSVHARLAATRLAALGMQ